MTLASRRVLPSVLALALPPVLAAIERADPQNAYGNAG